MVFPDDAPKQYRGAEEAALAATKPCANTRIRSLQRQPRRDALSAAAKRGT